MTRSEIDPDSWSATQRWLDELDRDTTADYPDAEPEQPPDRTRRRRPAARPRRRDIAAGRPAHRRPRTAPHHDGRASPAIQPGRRRGLRRRDRDSHHRGHRDPARHARRPHTAGETTSPTTQISVLPAAPDPAPSDADGDAPIPFTASASCLPGSTAAQAVAGDDPGRAWVCVRGGVDGQVLTLDLGRTMVDHRRVHHAWMGRRRCVRNRPVAGPPCGDPSPVDLQ